MAKSQNMSRPCEKSAAKRVSYSETKKPKRTPKLKDRVKKKHQTKVYVSVFPCMDDFGHTWYVYRGKARFDARNALGERVPGSVTEYGSYEHVCAKLQSKGMYVDNFSAAYKTRYFKVSYGEVV